MRVVEEISIADASAGWCAAIGSGSIGTLQLADDVVREIYKPGMAVARLACDIGDEEGPVAEVCRNVVWLLERQERFAHDNPTDGAPEFPGVRSMMLAACLARTSTVGLPRIPELEPEQELRKQRPATPTGTPRRLLRRSPRWPAR